MKRIITAALFSLTLSGCGTVFENVLACSLDRTQVYGISKYGPVGITVEYAKSNSACQEPLPAVLK